MAGYSDSPYRRIVKTFGCKLVYSEMISSEAIVRGYRKYEVLFEREEIPIIGQIFGSKPDIMKEAAIILESLGFSGIDINLGCPVKKVIKTGSGVALMENPLLLKRIVSNIKRSISIPLSAKIRLGFKKENYLEIGKLLEGEGIDFIAIHARMWRDMFKGPARLDAIKILKENLSIPVIGNGGIFSVKDAENMLRYSNCDGVMIARGSIGNPWIFSKLEREKINLASKIDTIKKHLSLSIEFYGEDKGIREFRKHLAKYIVGIKNASHIREKLMRITSYSLLLEELDSLKKYKEYLYI